MFTYTIDSVTNRVFSKDVGYCYISNPLFDPTNIQQLDLYTIENKTIVFSEVDLPKDSLHDYVYENGTFILDIQEEIETQEQIRAQKFLQLKNEIVTLPLEQLTQYHKKIIVNLSLTEEDWVALGC